MTTKPAPIVLFTYNRPWHLRQTVEALRKNELAAQSDLIIYSDGPKNRRVQTCVEDVRRYIRQIKGFKSLNIIERTENLGLANSIITGTTEVINEYEKVIVLEDDLVSSPDFLMFMNQALDFYQKEDRIFSVSGYGFPLSNTSGYTYDGYLSYRSMSWSWGTWKHKWQMADWDVTDFDSFIKNKDAQVLFNRGGEDLTHMLWLQIKGKIDSWSIRWDYTHYKHSAFCFCPVKSKIYNIGFDGSGTHCGHNRLKQGLQLSESKQRFSFPETVFIEPRFIEDIQKIHKCDLKRKIKRCIREALKL